MVSIDLLLPYKFGSIGIKIELQNLIYNGFLIKKNIYNTIFNVCIYFYCINITLITFCCFCYSYSR